MPIANIGKNCDLHNNVDEKFSFLQMKRCNFRNYSESLVIQEQRTDNEWTTTLIAEAGE